MRVYLWESVDAEKNNLIVILKKKKKGGDCESLRLNVFAERMMQNR